MINQVTIAGVVSDEPKMNETKSGHKICKLNVKTTKEVKKKDGSMATISAWHRLTLWGARAEDASTLREGDFVFAQGELQYGSYEKEGVKHYTTDINIGFDGKFAAQSGGVSESHEENPFD